MASVSNESTPPNMPESMPRSWKWIWLAAAGVALLTLAAFWPVFSNGFVNWDDHEYVLENPYIRSCSGTNLLAIWTQSRAASYQPLVFTTHALEYRAWGLNPAGYHAVNLGLHILNTLLVLALALALGLNRWPALLAAAWFGVHPLHVESVAWIAERKDVLCAFCYLLALWLYVRQARRAPARFAWAAFGAYLLALLSKPMAVTLPVLLVLCDLYLSRMRGWRYWIEKAIFVVPAALLFAVIWILHITTDPQGGSLWHNFQLACRAAGFCLAKLIAPVSLSVFYPRTAWENPIPFAVILILAALALGGGIAWAWQRRATTLLLGAAWFAVTFLPVSGIVAIGFVLTADRFMYLPSIGPFLALAAGLGALVARRPRWQWPAAAVSALSVAVLAVLTWQRCEVWRDSEALWRDAARKAPDHYTLRYLGMAQMEKGKYAEAQASLHLSLASSQTQYGRSYLADILRLQGKHDQAIRMYELFLSNQDWYVPVLSGYGLSLMEVGRIAQAGEAFRRCVQLDPNTAAHKGRLGWALMDQDRAGEAELIFKDALAQDPGDITSAYNYAVLLGRQGNFAAAEKLYRQILQADPKHLYALVNLGASLRSLGRIDEARSMLRRALELNPRDQVAADLLRSLDEK
jgi:tetratricopeptide (TPR) repeat protein